MTTRSNQRARRLLALGFAGLLGTSGASVLGPTEAYAGVASPAVVVSRMSTPQRVGQLFMVGLAAGSSDTAVLNDIRTRHIGNVILTGRSSSGVVATRHLTDRLQAQVTRASTGGLRLIVATDQEGGRVQVLSGPGFSLIPSALTQGTWVPATLRQRARTWGSELSMAGVNLDLAPVMDTVPSADAARSNPPIGAFQREFGYRPATVASHGMAFAQGLGDARVLAAEKHFPGLGRVTGNTDTTRGVTDRTTTRGDAYLLPFTAAVNAGSRFVMMSSAYYSRIDSQRPAAFSPTVIGTILRGDLRFRGVVVSDDLGNARQLAAWTPAQRALNFLTAGGDMVLTVNPAVLPQMYDAVLSRATTDRAFGQKVTAAALRVVTAKQGLVAGLPYPGYINHTLRRGTTDHQQTAVLQTRMQQLGDGPYSADGVFGPATEAAVRRFQARRYLVTDGIVGAVTGRAMGIWR